MSWKLRWAGWNKGMKRLMMEMISMNIPENEQYRMMSFLILHLNIYVRQKIT